MTTLLIRLAGPMQSWGDASRFSRRRSRVEPTKSGVLGLLAAAQGRRRTDPLEDLAALRFGARVDQRGQVMRDFQTARSLDGQRTMPLSHRFYLSDAVFVAAVEGDDSLIDALTEALQRPAFPLYLGRRACVPSRPLLLGVVDELLEPALRNVPWQAAAAYRRRQGTQVHLELIVDAPVEAKDLAVVESVRDVPQSFDPLRREYGWRDVVRLDPEVKDNPDGRDLMDFMAVHGGA